MSHFPPVILVSNETPTGLVNGVNTVYTLSKIPRPGYPITLMVAGVAVTAFTVSGATMTLSVAPLLGNSITVTYWY